MGLQLGAINLFKKVLSNGKVVKTQTLNGKTFTNVYDEAGNLLQTRAKKIERYNVGDKKVITTTVFKDDNVQKPGYYSKIVKDKVYTQEGTYLGSRRKSTFESHITYVPMSEQSILSGKNNLEKVYIAMKKGYYIKTVETGDIYKQSRYKNGIREYSYVSGKGSIDFNEHGLPKFNLETNGVENLF